MKRTRQELHDSIASWKYLYTITSGQLSDSRIETKEWEEVFNCLLALCDATLADYDALQSSHDKAVDQVAGWVETARTYAQNADYWRGRALKAEAELIEIATNRDVETRRWIGLYGVTPSC